jgi:sister chromatid cohesion protein DCC1
LDPAARFGKLFATQTRWRAEEIEPFLDDIAVDKKERDHLLLKYARAITDNGVWFITRVKYTE